MKNAIIYWFVFLALQVLAGGIIQGVYLLWNGPGAILDATGTILTMVLFSVVTMALFLWQKWAVVARHWIQTRPWVVLIWCVLAALGTIIPSGWLQEQMPELPNLVEEEFDMILRDRYGYFVVGLLVPLAEELVFRGAILRSLLKWNSRPWVAIFFFCRLVQCCPYEPSSDSPYVVDRPVVGLALLPYRQHCARSGVPLGKQYSGLCAIQLLPQSRP